MLSRNHSAHRSFVWHETGSRRSSLVLHRKPRLGTASSETDTMSRILLSAIWLCLLSAPTLAQWPPWAEEAFGGPRRWSHGPPRTQDLRPPAPFLADGGPRPQIAAEAPPVVAFPYAYPVASIVIDTSGRRLYYILESNLAYAYPISVGREGFSWTGSEKISRKQEWPDWHPPEEMRQRDSTLPAFSPQAEAGTRQQGCRDRRQVARPNRPRDRHHQGHRQALAQARSLGPLDGALGVGGGNLGGGATGPHATGWSPSRTPCDVLRKDAKPS